MDYCYIYYVDKLVFFSYFSRHHCQKANDNQLSSNEFTMKAYLLAVVLLGMTTLSFGTTFCVNFSDACCDANESTWSLQLGANDVVDNLYFHYDTGTKGDGVELWVTVDGVDVYHTYNLCGCGNVSFLTRIGPDHLLVVHAKCTYCSMPPCQNSTARVWVWTPFGLECPPSCSPPGDGGE